MFKLDRSKIIVIAIAAVTFLAIWQVQQTFFPKDNTPTLCMLANEGVSISAGETMILMDAFVRDGYPEDKLMSEGLRNTLWMAEPPYDEVDIITVSHKHIDHFDAPALMAHLVRNPGAKLVLPEEAYQDFLATDGGTEFESQLIASTPERGKPETFEVNGIAITIYNLDHRTEVENIGVLVELGGKTFFHMGDYSSAEFEENGIKDMEVDYLLLPYWYLRRAENFQLIQDNMKPKYLVPIHMPGSELPEDFAERVGSFEQLMNDVSTRADNVLMLYEEGACLRTEE